MRGSRNIIRRSSGRNVGFPFFGRKDAKTRAYLFLWDTAQLSLYDGRSLRDLFTGVTGCSRIVGERKS